MLRHGINDIRLFYENDVRFLKQFWLPTEPGMRRDFVK
jgi:hypothetical protein